MSENIIKKFDEFMSSRKFRRMMSQLEITGTTKRGFFSKSITFEIQVYYTPMKKVITAILPLNITIDELPFKRGDHIDVVKDWVKENGYKIEIEINR